MKGPKDLDKLEKIAEKGTLFGSERQAIENAFTELKISRKIVELAVCPDCGDRLYGVLPGSFAPCGNPFHTALYELEELKK